MATNYTTNYDLCQWEPTDPVIRTDFNADNAKLEAALSSLEKRVSMLCRVVPNLAYYIGQLGITKAQNCQYYMIPKNMLCQAFFDGDMIDCTGGALIQDGKLILNGAGATGSMTTANLLVYDTNWTQARLWIGYSGGNLSIQLNGQPMEYVRSYSGIRNSSIEWEQEYIWNGIGTNSVQITLNLDCGTYSSMTVYSYAVLLF